MQCLAFSYNTIKSTNLDQFLILQIFPDILTEDIFDAWRQLHWWFWDQMPDVLDHRQFKVLFSSYANCVEIWCISVHHEMHRLLQLSNRGGTKRNGQIATCREGHCMHCTQRQGSTIRDNLKSTESTQFKFCVDIIKYSQEIFGGRIETGSKQLKDLVVCIRQLVSWRHFRRRASRTEPNQRCGTCCFP